MWAKHTNNKQEPKLKTEAQPKHGFYKAEVFNMCEQDEQEEEPQEEEEQQELTHEDTPQEQTQETITQDDKPIRQLLNEILNSVNCVLEINELQNNNIKEVLNNINNNITNTINNNTESDNDNLTEFIKKQQLQNKTLMYKLDSILKAIT